MLSMPNCSLKSLKIFAKNCSIKFWTTISGNVHQFCYHELAIMYKFNHNSLKFQLPKQDIQNGGGVVPEEDSCVISEVASDSKEEEAKVVNVYNFISHSTLCFI